MQHDKLILVATKQDAQMPRPAEKLAESLELLRQLGDQGRTAIRSVDLPRTHRERLLKNGFLQEVMKGWYIPLRADQEAGESTAWLASFWSFCADYLRNRFDSEWCICPEQSIQLRVGNRTVPSQLVVRSPRGTNNVTKLPQNTTLLDLRQPLPDASDTEQKDGLNIFTIPAALGACSPNFFRQYPTDARTALATVTSASDVLSRLLDSGRTTVAGRLAGAFRNVGKSNVANDIVSTMKAAGYDCQEDDPFQTPLPVLFRSTERSPYVNRIRIMWGEMRSKVLGQFPVPPGLPVDIDGYLKAVDEISTTDAYHSLSIEGFRVTPELINQVRKNLWRPTINEHDRQQLDALTARGYYQASKSVRRSIRRILMQDDAGNVVSEDHGDWYRELFAPLVTANLCKPADLAGYRHDQVCIRNSKHVPPRWDAVRDLMPGFFELLQEEQEPAVRVVLGHFIFVYIHPYMDGNGRMGRFLMNAMLASGGYPWTVIPVTRKNDYLNFLERASVDQDILPFTNFLAELVRDRSSEKPMAKGHQ